MSHYTQRKKKIRLQSYGYETIGKPFCGICPKTDRHISQAIVDGVPMCFKHYAEYLSDKRLEKYGSRAFILPKKARG